MWQRRGALACAALLVGAMGGIAHADRMAQAHSLFSDACARCHSAEQLRPKTHVIDKAAPVKSALDRAKATAVKPVAPPVDPVRSWIERPTAVNPDTLCEAGRMDPAQRDLLVSFLRRPADPLRRSLTVAWIAEQHRGIAPKPEHAGPKLGQGDHR